MMKSSRIISWQSVADTLTAKAAIDGSLKSIKDAEEDLKVYECYKIDYVKKCLEEYMRHILEHSSGSKSRQRSEEIRLLGNTNFVKSHKLLIPEALRLYTKSIIEAPGKSEELAISLANRSAILFTLKDFERCMVDISLALEHGYPKKLKYKLLMRKGKCLFYLRNYSEAISVLESVKEDINALDSLSAEKKAELIQDVEINIKTAKSCTNVDCAVESKAALDSPVILPSPASGKNEEFPYASKLISIKCTEEKGRHVIAEQDIKMGDVLFVEKPYSHVLLEDQYNYYCHNCLEPLDVAIPCWDCVFAIFCSVKCQKEAWKFYHRWECGKALKIFYSIGIAHLGIKVLLRSASDTSNENKANYKRVYDLVTHIDRFSERDLFQYTLISTLLLIYLEQKTDFFEVTNYSKKADLGKVGHLLLRHVAQLISNGHAVTAFHNSSEDESNVATQQQVRVATAIYPSASMMNHSCDPNIANSFHNDTLIVKATKNIPKGSEVFNCYGPDFRRMNFKTRREILKEQYHFDCNCEPCKTDTEEHSFMDRFYEGYKCKECAGPSIPTSKRLVGKCLDCKRKQDCSEQAQMYEKAESLYEKACELMNQISDEACMTAVDPALKCLFSAHSLNVSSHYKFHRSITECNNQISRCYAVAGNHEKSILYLEKTLPAIKAQFGPLSIEYGNELQKLSDIMIYDLQKSNGGEKTIKEKALRSQKVLKELKIILDINCGAWNQQYKDLIVKEIELQSVMQSVKL